MSISQKAAIERSGGKIVKVMVSTDGKWVLMYNKEYKTSNAQSGFGIKTPMTQGLSEAMGILTKRYFYYRIKRKMFGKKDVELLHEAYNQDW